MNPMKHLVCMSISLLIAASAYGAEKIVFGEEQMRKFEKAIDQHAEQQSPRTFNNVHEHFPHSPKAPKNRCQSPKGFGYKTKQLIPGAKKR